MQSLFSSLALTMVACTQPQSSEYIPNATPIIEKSVYTPVSLSKKSSTKLMKHPQKNKLKKPLHPTPTHSSERKGINLPYVPTFL